MTSRVWKGNFPVSQPFKGPSVHDGLDVAMPTGTKLYAPANGQCSNLVGVYGENYQYIVYPDGTADILVHLNDFVASGNVKAGQLISHSGHTGKPPGYPNGVGSHLHFTRRTQKSNQASAIDPIPYLSEGGAEVVNPDIIGKLTYLAFHRAPTPDDLKRYSTYEEAILDYEKSDEHKKIADEVTVELPKLRKQVASNPDSQIVQKIRDIVK